MKKSKFLKIKIFGVAFLVSIFFSSCAMIKINMYYPYPSEAEDPPGLTIGSENFAYLGGPIRAIGDYDFEPGKGAIRDYPGRTLRVPSGENIKAFVYCSMPLYSYQSGSYQVTVIQYGFIYVSLPPLEKGCSYILYLSSSKSARKKSITWLDEHIIFMKKNPNTWKFENVHGAAFVD